MNGDSTVKLRFRDRLIVRLAVPTVLLVAALLCVVSVLMWYSYRGDIAISNTVPNEVVSDVAESVAHFFEVQELNLTLATKSLTGGSVGDEDRMFLSDIVEHDAAILEFAVYDTSGNSIFTTHDATGESIINSSNKVVSDSHKRVLLSKRSDITTPLRSTFNTSYVVWTFPIFDITGQRVEGLLSAVIDISTFWQYLDAAPSDLDALVVIADGDGNILVSNQTLPEKDFRSKIKDILLAGKRTELVERYYGLLDEKVAGRTLILPPTTWYVIAEVPLGGLMASTERNMAIMAGMLSLVGILAVYAFVAFERILLLPLRILADGVRELSVGHYQVHMRLPVNNELATLAGVMNTMASNIDARTSEIVLKLKRTISDLDRSAKALMKRDEEISKANERLKKLDQAKSEFVSIAAHQLRTPLSALKWAQQMLLDGEAGVVSDPQRLLLTQSQESVRRMVTLVNDLLSADHLEYGKVAYNFTAVNSEEIFSSIIGELRPMAAERDIKLLSSQSSTTGVLSADPERLKEVFLNILNNAIKYTPNHGTVTTHTVYGMGKVVYTITDTGIGIPEADRDRLFEKFVRMDNAKKVDANGSGLGLFIAKKIIDAHGGRIWFDSTEGKGTTFFVELPVTVAEEKRTL